MATVHRPEGGGPRLSRRQLCAGLGASLLVPQARGQGDGATRPGAEAPAGMHRQGQASLHFLGLRVYDATLWVSPGFEPLQWWRQPLVLTLRYARELSGLRIAERSLQEMERAGPMAPADAARWRTFLAAAIPDVRAGDVLSGHWLPASATTSLRAEGKAPARLQDAAFGERFFGIWLAPHSSQPALRRQLLGLPETLS